LALTLSNVLCKTNRPADVFEAQLGDHQAYRQPGNSAFVSDLAALKSFATIALALTRNWLSIETFESAFSLSRVITTGTWGA